MATKMTFTDSAIQRIKHTDKAEWYSDKTYRGLRLCVTSGSKTWYASKWDGAAQKSRQIKIGQFPKMTHRRHFRLCAVRFSAPARAPQQRLGLPLVPTHQRQTRPPRRAGSTAPHGPRRRAPLLERGSNVRGDPVSPPTLAQPTEPQRKRNRHARALRRARPRVATGCRQQGFQLHLVPLSGGTLYCD